MKANPNRSKLSLRFSNPSYFANRLVSLLLLVSLSTTSLFATPEAGRFMVVSMGERSQNMWARLVSVNLGSHMTSLAKSALLYFTPKQTPNEDRDRPRWGSNNPSR